jgi:ankyrin repeat protein
MSTYFGAMQQDIGDTILRNSQGVVGSVAGSVYFGEGPEASDRRFVRSLQETRRSLTLPHPGKALEACRAALYLTDPSIDRNNIIRAKGARTSGTCSWIKSNPCFQSWLRGDKNLLWIRGGPGKGKTMMSVYLTEEIASEKCRSLAYYFCVGQEMKQNSACAVLRGLLWQITEHHPNLMQHILPHFDPPERGKATVLSEETLWNILREICSHAETQRLFCLVDGVDECDEDSMHWLVDKFSSVEHDPAFSKLSLIVLSRPVVGIDDSSCITLDPDHHGQVSADVEIFVRSKARALSRKLRVDGNFEDNATRILLEKSEGTFLWVGFVMSELLKKQTRSQVEKAMYSLPRGLPAVYARMLRNIEPDDQENGKKLLACIAVAFKPLSLKTLADILGCRSSATISEEQATLDAIAVCAPMLHIRDKRVDLVHQSAKDYLLRGSTDVDPLLEGFRVQPEVTHLYLARRCIQSLVEGSWLQYYSLMNWPSHAKYLGTVTFSLLEQEPQFFEEVSVPRDLWWRKYSLQFLGLPKVVPPRLHIACFLGLSTWVRVILSQRQRSAKSVAEVVDEKCPGEWLALDYSVKSASEDIMELLLDVTSKSSGPHDKFDNTLRRAVLAEREVVVGSILRHGANVNVCDVEGKSLLLHATTLENKAIMQILLRHGADPDLIDNSGLQPLEVAFQMPQAQALQLIKLLLVGGADPNARPYNRHTYLNRALLEGKPQIVRLLLENGADTTLSAAQSSLTLSGDSDVEKEALPFHIAVAQRSVDMVQLLIDRGVDVNMRDGVGRTAIHVVTAKRNAKSSWTTSRWIQHLSAAGVDINAKRHDGKTALHIAIQNKSFQMAYDLCECGASVSAQDSLGETALHYAVRKPRTKYSWNWQLTGLIRFLMHAGADVNAKRKDGVTALHVFMQSRDCFETEEERSECESDAERCIFHEVLSVLQLAGADFNAHNLEGKTPLHSAAEQRDSGPLRDLIEFGARWNVRDSSGDTALHIAMRASLSDTDSISLVDHPCARDFGHDTHRPNSVNRDEKVG